VGDRPERLGWPDTTFTARTFRKEKPALTLSFGTYWMPLRNLLILLGMMALSLACYIKAPRNRYANLVAQCMEIVARHSVHETSSRELYENAMAGMVTGLDVYSQFLPPDVLRPLQQDIDQQFGGVGIVVEQNTETEQFVILSPSVGSPAHKAGIVAGDVILEVEGRATQEMTFREVVSLIRGEPGTPVRLKVRHADQPDAIAYTLTRAIIDVPSVLGDRRRPDGSWQYFFDQEPQLGYIRISTFGEQTSAELRRALGSIEGQVDSLIIDLRNNAGGSLAAAVECCDLFLTQGNIVTTRGRNDELQSSFRAGPRIGFPVEYPVVVLVNRFSASASEIVAACLQDHQRAVIVGERTWGKGTVQSLFLLEGGRSALKLTIANYSRPSGANIQRWDDAGEDEAWGVQPSDGFLVQLDDEQLVSLARRRSRRDLALDDVPLGSHGDVTSQDDRTNGVDRTQAVDDAAADDGDDQLDGVDQPRNGGDATGESAAGELEDPSQSEQAQGDQGWLSIDPQLRRAVEYLLDRRDQ